MDKKCENCVYFHLDISHEFGECRHYPPDTHVIDGEVVTVFPLVLNDEWCGEWTEREGLENMDRTGQDKGLSSPFLDVQGL